MKLLMKRNVFLTITGSIALIIGFTALIFPTELLESKGVISDDTLKVWVMEVGILLLAMGCILILIRNEKDSRALKAIFIGNIIIHIGLFTIELIAYKNHIITEIMGIIPNGILHFTLIILLLNFVFKMNSSK